MAVRGHAIEGAEVGSLVWRKRRSSTHLNRLHPPLNFGRFFVSFSARYQSQCWRILCRPPELGPEPRRSKLRPTGVRFHRKNFGLACRRTRSEGGEAVGPLSSCQAVFDVSPIVGFYAKRRSVVGSGPRCPLPGSIWRENQGRALSQTRPGRE